MAKVTKTSKPNTTTKPMVTKTAEKGYKNHNKGSRKEKVHELYDKQGADAAFTLGAKLKLKESTLRSWFGSWAREASSKKATAKAA